MRWSSHAQQAPSPVQSSPVVPAKSASNSAQFSNGGTTRHSSSSAATVRPVLNQFENRLARSHPSAPTVMAGAGRAGSICARLRWKVLASGVRPAVVGSLIVRSARCGDCTSS